MCVCVCVCVRVCVCVCVCVMGYVYTVYVILNCIHQQIYIQSDKHFNFKYIMPSNYV